MLKELLKERDLLPILRHADGTAVTKETWSRRRQEFIDALATYSYGHTPPAPERVWADIIAEDSAAYAGKVLQQELRVSFETERGVFSFPAWLYVPHGRNCPSVLLNLSFPCNFPSEYVPIEEITDAGYALVVVFYTDIVNDRHHGDFSDGLAAYFGVSENRGPEEWGKIGMWAYGVSRVLDYLLTRSDVDAQRTAVIGHSRLGKTALWAAAQDERFWCAIANESGYGGAASSKHGEGERVQDFLRAGSWDWYCENFKQFADEKEDHKPYDQAWLLALIAPRYLCVGSAIEDAGADPKAEFLTSLWASQAWELYGLPGLITPDHLPKAGDVLSEGTIGYHVRAGQHFLSREDWNYYIRFLDKKRAESHQ